MSRVAMTIKRPLLEHARFYQSLGLQIVPLARPVLDDDNKLICSCWRGGDCHDPGKHPAYKGWRDANIDVFREWGMGRAANIGIQTGAVSGIVVVDIDPRHGGDEALKELETRHGALPLTWLFRTGGGGEHYLFKHPGDGSHVPGRPNALGPGIDIRGDGNLIVAPPSWHVSGNQYAIDVDHHPEDVPLAPLPEWIAAKLVRRKPKPRLTAAELPALTCDQLSPRGEQILDRAYQEIVTAPNGEQEVTLNRCCYGIGRLVGSNLLPAEFTLRVLHEAAAQIADYDLRNPWRADFLAEKVERAFGDGLLNPWSNRQ